MILVDTGPLVALHNPRDSNHRRCVETLDLLDEPLLTTLQVLTEAFHLLPAYQSGVLMNFIARDGIEVSFSDPTSLSRTLTLMAKYADRPMDFADASLVACAEQFEISTVFTLDRADFATYRIRRGHRQVPFEVIP